MKRAIAVLFSTLPSLWGQIAQSHPEYCGIPGGVNPPLPEISATIDQRGHATLYLGRGNSGPGIDLTVGSLPSMISEIAEVCPLSDGRMVLFGDYGGTAVFIIDPAKGSLVDSFDGYDPVISPNQRWIAFIKAYPLHGVAGSDEYLLYDLSKSPAQNRSDGSHSITEVGTVLFPPGHENYPASNIDLPDELSHRGGQIHWAPDSRAMLLWDGAHDGPGVVLLTLDDKGAPTALRHPLTIAEICGRPVPRGESYRSNMERAEIGPDVGGTRAIRLDFTPFGISPCVAHVLQLHTEDFHPVRPEVNRAPTYTRGTRGIGVDGKRIRPPREKK